MALQPRQRFLQTASLISCCVLSLAAPMCPAKDAVREYVDETTAASVTASTETLVFARERTDLAVNARDYITLAPVEINRAGRRTCFWSGYLWSTIDRRNGQSFLAEGDELVLLADGRPMRLRRSGKPPSDEGVGELITPSPVRTAIQVLFATTPEEIAYLAHASEVHIELLHAGMNESFVLWKGRPGRLSGFAKRISP